MSKWSNLVGRYSLEFERNLKFKFSQEKFGIVSLFIYS